MWNSIKNLTNAAADFTVIAVKKTCHQSDSANECCTDMTRKVRWRAGMVRKEYEERVAERRRKTLMIEYVAEH